MNDTYDVMIIGAGIIGACSAFELSRRGFRTLNIDKQPAAGYGSTSNSCAVIRTHYSTFQGTALSYENHHYWKNWSEFLELDDEPALARYRQTGIVAIKKNDADLEILRKHHSALDIPYEDWDPAELKERMPYLDLRSFYPPKRPDEEGFLEPTGGRICGAFYTPVGGYINDPVLTVRNVQHAEKLRQRLQAGLLKHQGGVVATVVLDLESGAVREYTNPLGTPFIPRLDTAAFDTCP